MDYRDWTLTTFVSHGRHGVFCIPPASSPSAQITIMAVHETEFEALRKAIQIVDAVLFDGEDAA